MEWGPPRVRLSVPPEHGVHLLACGLDPAGEWWALVTWERYVARGSWLRGGDAALVLRLDPRQHLAKVDHEDYARVPRVRLDKDQRWWPAPPGPRPGHYGILDATTALEPPGGMRWCTPRYSKRR